MFIAMAGQHQVWQFDAASGIATSFSGNGYERNQNGTSGLNTAWAQPSGLALAPSGDALFVAGARVCCRRKRRTRVPHGMPLWRLHTLCWRHKALS